MYSPAGSLLNVVSLLPDVNVKDLPSSPTLNVSLSDVTSFRLLPSLDVTVSFAPDSSSLFVMSCLLIVTVVMSSVMVTGLSLASAHVEASQSGSPLASVTSSTNVCTVPSAFTRNVTSPVTV